MEQKEKKSKRNLIRMESNDATVTLTIIFNNCFLCLESSKV